MRTLKILIPVIFVVCLISLPFALGTRVYPVTVVSGDSMVPSLYNGDIVVFTGRANHPIANGTVIVFVQSSTNLNGLEILMRPVVIHRVVGTLTQADGTVYYKTKGDNNQFPDPILVREGNVLGVPVLIIPRIGILFLFFSSPQGLIALIALITLFYLGRFDIRRKEVETKHEFLASLSSYVLMDDISYELFQYVSIITEYGKKLTHPKNSVLDSFFKWLGNGNLEKGYTIEEMSCPRCGSKAVIVRGKVSGDETILCSACFTREQVALRLSLENTKEEIKEFEQST